MSKSKNVKHLFAAGHYMGSKYLSGGYPKAFL